MLHVLTPIFQPQPFLEDGVLIVEASKTNILARMAWGFVACALSTQKLSLLWAGVSGPSIPQINST